jgi:uncharacterized protein YhdP
MLREVDLTGTIDADLEVYLASAAPEDTRLTGRLATRGVAMRLPGSGVSVKTGESEFTLSGNAIRFQRVPLRLNEQAMEVSGRVANPLAPDVHLAVTLPLLDLDRLIPEAAKRAPETNASLPSERTGVDPGKSELPRLAREATGRLEVQAAHGRYRGLSFRNLALRVGYDRGLLTGGALDFDGDGGHVSATGSADLRDPGGISFFVRPHVTSLGLEAVGQVFGLERPPVTGPLSLSGELQGRTGTREALLQSLEGSLDATMGPGRFSRVGKIGAPLAKLLSFASLRGLLSGSLFADLTGRGLAYRTIRLQADFSNGSMRIGRFGFESDAMNIDAQGSVDLISEQMDARVELRSFGTVDKLLSFIPIVGRPLEAIASIPLEVQGPVDDPDVRLAVGQGITGAIRQETESTGPIIPEAADPRRQSPGR